MKDTKEYYRCDRCQSEGFKNPVDQIMIINDSLDTSLLTNNHTVSLALNSHESTTVMLSSQGGTVTGSNHNISGVVNSAIDTVNINGTYANANFQVLDSTHIKVTVGTSVTYISNIEQVHFNGDGSNVLIVGAGGFNSLTEASSTPMANNSTIFVADPSLATGANGVIHSATTNIYLTGADTSPAVMIIDPSVAVASVNIYGTHSFTLTANNGTDTIADHTFITTGHVNNISAHGEP